MASPQFLVAGDPAYRTECEFVLQWIFTERWGTTWEWHDHVAPGIHVSLSGHTGRLELPDSFFRSAAAGWLTAGTVQLSSDGTWNATTESPLRVAGGGLPLLFEAPGGETSFVDGRFRVPIDILGSVFFLISGYEEAASQERDGHRRVPLSAVWAARRGVLDRPIADEYVEGQSPPSGRRLPGNRHVRGFWCRAMSIIRMPAMWGVRRRRFARLPVTC